MTGAFDERGWMKVYEEAYKNLQPVGWIDDVSFFSSAQGWTSRCVLGGR